MAKTETTTTMDASTAATPGLGAADIMEAYRVRTPTVPVSLMGGQKIEFRVPTKGSEIQAIGEAAALMMELVEKGAAPPAIQRYADDLTPEIMRQAHELQQYAVNPTFTLEQTVEMACEIAGLFGEITAKTGEIFTEAYIKTQEKKVPDAAKKSAATASGGPS